MQLIVILWRWGGEGVTRYAFDVDAANHASDWFFENIANVDANPGTLPFNSSCDTFLQTTFQYGGNFFKKIYIHIVLY